MKIYGLIFDDRKTEITIYRSASGVISVWFPKGGKYKVHKTTSAAGQSVIEVYSPRKEGK